MTRGRASSGTIRRPPARSDAGAGRKVVAMRLSALLVTVLLGACSAKPETQPAPPPADAPAAAPSPDGAKALPPAIAEILKTRCEKCHSPPDAAGGLDMRPENAYASLVGRPSRQVPSLHIVEPGDPDRSYLMAKLLGRHRELGGRGVAMPKKGGPLEQAQIDAIRAWIKSL